MLRKLSTVALCIVLIATLGTVSYSATPNDSDEKETNVIEAQNKEKLIEIVTPVNGTITSQKTILLSGKTKTDLNEDDITVTVEIYSTRDSAIDYFENDIYINNGLINEELSNEMLSLEITENELIKINTKNIEIDILGLFNEEIKLLSGKNKLVVVVKKKENVIYSEELLITVTDDVTALKYLENENNINILENIKNDILSNEQ